MPQHTLKQLAKKYELLYEDANEPTGDSCTGEGDLTTSGETTPVNETDVDPRKYQYEDEVKTGDKTYYVFANFDYEEDSTGYEFDPRRGAAGQGRDQRSVIPYKVTDLRVFEFVNDKEVEITDENILKGVREAVLSKVRDDKTLDSEPRYDRWM